MSSQGRENVPWNTVIRRWSGFTESADEPGSNTASPLTSITLQSPITRALTGIET